ncbi:hypothetical protein PFLUV_G00007190 [Scomber scombrus]|uniref:Uncharacterized protein n=1 Tax=Scomber scombrus TaxID=13677 RepID=A0AAV1N1Q1_SCOSC
MSGNLYAEPGIITKGHHDQHNKEENMMDIYVSAESLRVYDNPWMEGMTPNTPEPAEVQHPVVSRKSGKRSHIRTNLAFLGMLCLLLLTVIIYLGVQMGKDTRERNKLQAINTELKRKSHQLEINNTLLTKERDVLWRNFCEKKKPKKCKNLDLSKNP